MIFNILKRDLKRKKAMNFILFLFIILTSTFMASSANNLIVTTSAVDQFIEKANVPEYTILSLSEETNNKQIETWLENQEHVTAYQKEEQIFATTDSLKKETGKKYDFFGSTVFTKIPKVYNKVFNMEDEPIELKPGEVAIPFIEGERNNLNIGDILKFTIGGVTKNFTIKYVMKDALFGTSFMGYKQLFISEEDFKELYDLDQRIIINLYFVESDNISALEKDFIRQPFQTTANLTISILKMTYIMDMIIAAILMVVSICLICIAFFILRFTIVFTIQEDYKEIGIMKAIGIKSAGIKSIYIIKYFFISIIGAAIGVFVSFPFSNLLLGDIKQNIVIEDSGTYLTVNIISGLIVVVLVLVFCFMCANKLNQFSAMEAIRSGSSGERFTKKNFMKLHNRGAIPAMVYMAINDLLTNWKRYLSLVATFIIGTVLIILPLNAVNTLKDDSLVTLFGLAKADVYLTSNFEQFLTGGMEDDKLLKNMENMEKLYATEDVFVKLYAECVYSIKMYAEDKEESNGLLATQAKEFNTDNYTYLEGTPPKLENEIAITEISAKKLGVGIGDVVHITFGREAKEYLITATYQSMYNLGTGVRFSESANISQKELDEIYTIAGYFEEDTDVEKGIETIKRLTPKYEPKNGNEFMATSMGSIINRVDQMKMLILVVILFINCLITVMMVRMFVAKDIGEIAMLKSIGFSNNSIRIWQALRISVLLVFSIIIGILLSNPLNSVMGAFTFEIMGASQIEMIIVPWEVFGLYPIILLVGTTVAAWITTMTINRVTLQDMNNIE